MTEQEAVESMEAGSQRNRLIANGYTEGPCQVCYGTGRHGLDHHGATTAAQAECFKCKGSGKTWNAPAMQTFGGCYHWETGRSL